MAFQTSGRQRGLAKAIAHSAMVLAQKTGSVMDQKLAPFLREGEAMPDAGLLQQLLARYLEAQGDDLAAADQAYNSKVGQHRALRLELAEALAQARWRLRDFRLIVDRVFGAGSCQLILGTRNFTTRDPAALASLLRQGAMALRTPAFAFEPRPELAPGGSAGLADLLEAEARQLTEMTEGRLLPSRFRRSVGLGDKDEKLAATRTAISEGALLLKGLLTFTGNGFHARRLRPSHRKKGGGSPAPAKDV